MAPPRIPVAGTGATSAPHLEVKSCTLIEDAFFWEEIMTQRSSFFVVALACAAVAALLVAPSAFSQAVAVAEFRVRFWTPAAPPYRELRSKRFRPIPSTHAPPRRMPTAGTFFPTCRSVLTGSKSPPRASRLMRKRAFFCKSGTTCRSMPACRSARSPKTSR